MKVIKVFLVVSSVSFGLSLFSQTYDTVFTGNSGTNYNWDDPANWSAGIPSESSKILIESAGLSSNNLAISGTAAVDCVEWNIIGSAASQKGIAKGGMLKANSIVIDGKNYWSQLFSQGSFDASNGNGTGSMVLKSSVSLYFKASTIKADILKVESGAHVEVDGGGTADNPQITATKYLQLDTDMNTTGKSGNTFIKLGGIRGAGEVTVKNGSETAAGYIEFANSDVSEFSGKFSLSNPTWGGSTNKSIHITMNGSAEGIQRLANAESEVTSVTVKSGEISMLAKNAGEMSVEGGILSVYDFNGTVTDNALNADSLSWSGGKIRLAVGADFNSRISLSGALKKGENAGGMEIELSFAEGAAEEFSALLETEESVVRELITYTSSDFDANDGSVFVSGPDGFSYELMFGENALSVAISQIPEPSALAAIFGAAALALAIRKRRQNLRR